MNSTLVFFPQKIYSCIAQIKYIGEYDENHLVIVTDSSPFHPINLTWSDQPGDTGWITINQTTSIAIVDSVELLYDCENDKFYFGLLTKELKNNQNCSLLVGHLIKKSDSKDLTIAIGASIELQVDKDKQDSLSKAHTICHLTSLALNKVLNNKWSKDYSLDCLGNCNFDQTAIKSSQLKPNLSIDIYRVGKSIKKRGFKYPELFDNLAQLQFDIQQQINTWLQTQSIVEVVCDGPALKDRRYWQTTVCDGAVRIACGGTHIQSLSELTEVKIIIEAVSDEEFVIKSLVI